MSITNKIDMYLNKDMANESTVGKNVKLENEGPNSVVVTLGDLEIYFSYKTPVAFKKGGTKVVSKNIWSSTTGRFINSIEPDPEKRIDNKEFMQELGNIIVEY